MSGTDADGSAANMVTMDRDELLNAIKSILEILEGLLPKIMKK